MVVESGATEVAKVVEIVVACVVGSVVARLSVVRARVVDISVVGD